MTKLTVRERQRRGYVKEAQGYTAWTEFQVIYNRKIIGRFDFRRINSLPIIKPTCAAKGTSHDRT